MPLCWSILEITAHIFLPTLSFHPSNYHPHVQWFQFVSLCVGRHWPNSHDDLLLWWNYHLQTNMDLNSPEGGSKQVIQSPVAQPYTAWSGYDALNLTQNKNYFEVHCNYSQSTQVGVVNGHSRQINIVPTEISTQNNRAQFKPVSENFSTNVIFRATVKTCSSWETWIKERQLKECKTYGGIFDYSTTDQFLSTSKTLSHKLTILWKPLLSVGQWDKYEGEGAQIAINLGYCAMEHYQYARTSQFLPLLAILLPYISAVWK